MNKRSVVITQQKNNLTQSVTEFKNIQHLTSSLFELALTLSKPLPKTLHFSVEMEKPKNDLKEKLTFTYTTRNLRTPLLTVALDLLMQANKVLLPHNSVIEASVTIDTTTTPPTVSVKVDSTANLFSISNKKSV
jgi:hypothetical protein